jgi:hypothetical protein
MLPPLLITSSIKVSAPYTQLTDTGERLALTLEYLAHWVRNFSGLRIVLCDGSGYILSDIVSREFPNRDIECLAFTNDAARVAEFGKGFGEGEIVNYAIRNSSLLRGAGYFAKITSKMWVRNFRQCANIWNGHFLGLPVFQYNKTLDKVTFEKLDTRFYIVDKNFYLANFASAHLRVRDSQGYHLEHSFRDAILEKRLRSFGFPLTPAIDGVSGSLGRNFSEVYGHEYRLHEALGRVIACKTTDFICQQ